MSKGSKGAKVVMGGEKVVTGMIRLMVPAGKAAPAPPVGPALGQKGLNLMEFCKYGPSFPMPPPLTSRLLISCTNAARAAGHSA